MSNENRTPPHYFLESAELPPPTSNIDGMPWLIAHQPGANYAAADHGSNYGQHRDNLWPNSSPTANLEREYFYETNTNIGHPTPSPRNAQHVLGPPGPSRVEYDIPPAHDIPDAEVIDYLPPPMLGVTDAFSRSVRESAPSGMSAKECLRRLADRYLNDPGSQVDTLRMGLSPSEGRLKVIIVLDIDI